jgi:hypothetical protein
MIFIDENVNEKKEIMNASNIHSFCKKLKNKTRSKIYMLVYFEIFDTLNAQITLQVILYISLI